MSGGLRILIILTVMFIGIYFYSISYRYIRAAKEKKRNKEILNKEETFRQRKMKSQKDREEKAWIAELRHKEIKRQFKWLKGINKDIKKKEEILLDK